MVVLEAMSLGKPIVSTEVGGIPEAVVNEETGLLVPVGDHEASPPHFSGCHNPAPSPNNWPCWASSAIARCSLWERMVAEYAEVFEDVLERRDPSVRGGSEPTSSIS